MKSCNQTSANVTILPEQESGMRFCKACNKLLPLNQFRADKRKYTCISHLRAAKRHQVLGTHKKRAFNSLRCRARQDMLTFGHKYMMISRKQVTEMLSDEHMAHFPQYGLIPIRPDKPLTFDNAVIASTFQRSYVLGKWKKTHDPIQYEQDLRFLLEAQNTPFQMCK